MRPLLLAAVSFLLSGCFGNNLNEADLSDPGIKARIETEFQAQPDLDLRYVTLDVHDRVVTVSGLINSFADKQTVYRIVQRTKGVEQVIINLVTQE